MSDGTDILLSVNDLKVHFPIRKGVLARTVGYVQAVNGVSFELRRGEVLGIVGESGCGKSTTARAILGLVKPTSGSIEKSGRVQAVFQDPLASLNPRHTIFEAITEAPVYHGLFKRADARGKAVELLESVGLNESALDKYPHEFSGGERQRICIARAIAMQPDILICDEAVSALDLSVRAQVLALLRDLGERYSLSIIFITHDLGVIQHIADRILVMNRGEIVERGGCRAVLATPKEDYTRRLKSAVQRIAK